MGEFGGGSSRPLEKRGGRTRKKNFPPLVSKQVGGGGVGALAPQLDRPLVYSLEHVLLTGEALE